MRWEIEKCPDCGAQMAGTFDKLNGIAMVFKDDKTEEFEWTGTTEVLWNDQCTVRDAEGRDILACSNCYSTWGSRRIEEPEAEYNGEYVVMVTVNGMPEHVYTFDGDDAEDDANTVHMILQERYGILNEDGSENDVAPDGFDVYVLPVEECKELR